MTRGIFILLTLWCLANVYAESTDSFKTRPGPEGSPTPITTAIYIVDVREIDGARQFFSADVFVRLRWKDQRLAGQGVRTMSLNDVWQPAIQIVNRVTVQTTLPEVIEVDQDGNVTYRQRFIGQFSCFLDLSEFPFDRQTLPISFAAPGKSASEVQFVQDQESGLAQRLSVTDWKVGTWRMKEEPYRIGLSGRSIPGYRFEFEAARYLQFFLMQIIAPMTLILGMSWIVFWLDPTQPGPRISMSITSMLTIVAYRLLLGNFLPRLSYLTRMDYFVFGCTFLVFLSLLTVVIITRLMMKKKEPTALLLDKYARWIFPGLFVLVLFCAFATP